MRKANRLLFSKIAALGFSVIAGLPLLAPASFAAETRPAKHYFGVRVVDAETKRGVPLVELRTVNDILSVTDSAGWIAFHEPGLMDREVYFAVRSPGYEVDADGFGFKGFKLLPRAGESAEVRMRRVNYAKRLYRVTGQGIYRDSTLLGQSSPARVPDLNLGVVGQDSVQAVPYQGGIFWLWGDTNLVGYPLGNFQTTSAQTPRAGRPDHDVEVGVPLVYFRKADDAARLQPMAPLTEPGPVWLFGLLVANDEQDRQRLVSHYTRQRTLSEVAEHGLMLFDDEQQIFKKLVELPPNETWRHPQGNAVLQAKDTPPRFYFCSPFAHTRVAADYASVIDVRKYESLWFDVAANAYRWQAEHSPTSQADERQLIETSRMQPNAARYQLADRTGKLVSMHCASIVWNAYREKWVLIGVSKDTRKQPSFLGEVWYAESAAIDGPWTLAVKVATHPNYSFYNPRIHAFYGAEYPRRIYFEGTYTKTFSGNESATPRYEYNQLMYRLDLDDPKLQAELSAKAP